MNKAEKVFAQGFYFKKSENAPDFVVGNISVKVEEAIEFLKENDKKGWINMSVKQSKKGSHYMELDTFEPKPQKEEEKDEMVF